MFYSTGYFDNALHNLQSVVDKGVDMLEGRDFDTLVGTGFSGAVVVPALALALGKGFVLVRKESDDSHHGRGRLLGTLGSRWVFVDDFISSGSTRDRVMAKINDCSVDTVNVGAYLYGNFSNSGNFVTYSDLMGFGYSVPSPTADYL